MRIIQEAVLVKQIIMAHVIVSTDSAELWLRLVGGDRRDMFIYRKSNPRNC